MRIESKYLEHFKKANKSKAKYTMRGNRVLVEILPKEEIKSEGGIIIQSSDRQVGAMDEHRSELAVVLDVGDGYVDDDGQRVECKVKPGYVVIMPEMGMQYKATWPGINGAIPTFLALVPDSSLGIYWESIEEFNQYVKDAQNEEA